LTPQYPPSSPCKKKVSPRARPGWSSSQVTLRPRPLSPPTQSSRIIHNLSAQTDQPGLIRHREQRPKSDREYTATRELIAQAHPAAAEPRTTQYLRTALRGCSSSSNSSRVTSTPAGLEQTPQLHHHPHPHPPPLSQQTRHLRTQQRTARPHSATTITAAHGASCSGSGRLHPHIIKTSSSRRHPVSIHRKPARQDTLRAALRLTRSLPERRRLRPPQPPPPSPIAACSNMPSCIQMEAQTPRLLGPLVSLAPRA